MVATAINIANYSSGRGNTDSAACEHGSLLYLQKDIVFWVFEVHIPNAVVMHLIDYDMWILAVYQPPSYTIMINPCC